jgi:hypothetical protein
MRIRSVHSRRTELIQRSAKAFIRGACGAVSMIWMPMEARTASKAAPNFASRSRWIGWCAVGRDVSVWTPWRGVAEQLAVPAQDGIGATSSRSCATSGVVIGCRSAASTARSAGLNRALVSPSCR